MRVGLKINPLFKKKKKRPKHLAPLMQCADISCKISENYLKKARNILLLRTTFTQNKDFYYDEHIYPPAKVSKINRHKANR